MLNAFPVQPDQDLLIEPLRVPAPRRVRYSRWVTVSRICLLNGWVAGILAAHMLTVPASRDNVTIAALLSGAAILGIECYFRNRRDLLSKGEATVGVVLSRKVTQTKDAKAYEIHYCYWTRVGSVMDKTISVSKKVHDGCPDGIPITVLYHRRLQTESLPLFLLREAELV